MMSTEELGMQFTKKIRGVVIDEKHCFPGPLLYLPFRGPGQTFGISDSTGIVRLSFVYYFLFQ